jgi:uncharacterized protein with von Willebrand factor type A (vWA) domain
LSLRATLVKDSAHLPIFDELFPLFFGSQPAGPLQGLPDDLSPEEARMLAEALREFNEQLRKLLDRLMRGEPLSKDELDRLGELIGLNKANDLRAREWMAKRLEKALKFPEIREAIEELMDILAQMGMSRERIDQLRQMLESNSQALQDQLRQFAGMRIAENMSNAPPDESLDDLFNRPFNSLSDRDLDRLRKEVRRLANILRTRIALRQKRAKGGQLDAKATIRANLKHGNVPIEIRHKDRTLKPRLVVICDISTSMRPVSELMLSVLYAMQDQISKTHAFAFIDHLEYISPDFSGSEAREAVASVLQRMPSGYYNTDLGSSLDDFAHEYLHTLDSRSTFIIVGDGRNNYNDPRLDVFRDLCHRSNRTIWLNPEPPVLWGRGDSDMLKYAAHCNAILQVTNLAELTAAIDHLLS